MRNSFSLYELSEAEMESLGLLDKRGDLTIEPEELEILLAGRRTSLLRLHDLSSNGMQIAQMDAKLSLHRNSEGQAIIRIHPVYHKPQLTFARGDAGAQALIDGKQLHCRYMMAAARAAPDEPLNEYEYILEYDAETREFLSYEPRDVPVPDRINGFELTMAQRTDYSRGIPVALPDSTILVYKATESNGLLANRWSLILSKDTDDGKDFELLEGIRPLGAGQIEEESQAFLNEYAVMNTQKQPSFYQPVKVPGRKRG